MLRDEDKKEISKRLSEMKDDVHLVFFTQQLADICQFCTETERLLTEVATLSDQLVLDIKNFVTDTDDVEDNAVQRIPATVIKSQNDPGVKFYGIPTGYEFAAFLETILLVSQKKSQLDQAIQDKLKELKNRVHIQVFVTPTCPYCTKVALMAYQLAIENTFIFSDIIEITEFPQLAQKYNVSGVPKVVLNETVTFEGAVPEDYFVDQVLKAGNLNTSKG